MSITEKLLEIQQSLNAPKNLTNAFGKYKYRSLEGILAAVKPLLKDQKCILTISDKMVEVGGRVYVEASVLLTSTECDGRVEVCASAREAENKKGMDDAQITGAASSYARKYACNGLFAIDDTKDADATNDHGKKEKKFVPSSYNEVMAEVDKCKNSVQLNKWMAANKDRIGKMPEADRDKVRNLCQQYVDIFKKEIAENG